MTELSKKQGAANSYPSSLLDLLTRMQAAATPIDLAHGDDDARIPAALWREFVDAHADMLRGCVSATSSEAAPHKGER